MSAACWIDLQGYGSLIASANFNPLHPKAISAVSRLRTFHEIVAGCSGKNFKTLTVNDGAVAYQDLSLKDSSTCCDFLVKSWELFQRVNEKEVANAFGGARLVLAAGFRVLGSKRGIDHNTALIVSILERLHDKDISLDQAKKEAGKVRRSFDIEPQLQANFAFTKAYLAETSGTKGGLPGNNFYLDSAFLDENIPAWIEVGPVIEWSNTRPAMAGNFFRVNALSLSKCSGNDLSGLRNGLQIAQHLSQDENVLQALQRTKK